MSISKLQVMKDALTSRAARKVLVAQKHSPTVLFGVGVAGVVATTVLASRATLKLEGVLEDAQKDSDTAIEVGNRNLENYTQKDVTRDLAHIRVRTALRIGKLYAPAIAVGVTSVCALGGSHIILTKRNASLVAAYAAVEKGFAEYRARVVEEVGEEKEREFRYGVETERVDDTKAGKVKETKRASGAAGASVYARFFDETSLSWKSEPSYNRAFLNAQQNYANDLLRSRGHLFLNEVYDMLGLERSKEGAVVGWVISKDGDNFVDFGVFNSESERARAFVNGLEGAILLDFNVDGVIWDKI